MHTEGTSLSSSYHRQKKVKAIEPQRDKIIRLSKRRKALKDKNPGLHLADVGPFPAQ